MTAQRTLRSALSLVFDARESSSTVEGKHPNPIKMMDQFAFAAPPASNPQKSAFSIDLIKYRVKGNSPWGAHRDKVSRAQPVPVLHRGICEVIHGHLQPLSF
ncbi:hypothetical protein [Glutamicibacter uratoxydans]|uniref:hypothetical protein n=1 Tax=Glutamicibacter uratoxydans TaxID=43667 RepID=UPI0011433967|nr:hypothetical protein [Glutamicibacter uratoxydans]